MTSQVVSAIKGTVIRVMGLTSCGVPVTGAGSSMVVEPGFISLKPSPQYEDGQEFTQKRADGLLCVNQKDPGQLKRVDIDGLFCVLNPDLIVVMTGSRLITNSAPTGSGVIFSAAAPIPAHFSLEVWQQVSGPNACLTGVQQYVYWAFPHCFNAQVGDFEVQNDVLQWDMKLETNFAYTGWGSFPTAAPPNTYLGAAGQLQAGDMYAYDITTTAPPANTNGAVTIS